MKKRIFLLLLAVPMLLLTLALGAWTWLWHSESGAQWLWRFAHEQLTESLPGTVLDGNVTGTLARGLVVRSFTFRSEAIELGVKRVELAARLDFSPARLIIRNVEIEQLALEFFEAGEDAHQTSDQRPHRQLALPIPIIVETLRLGDALVSRGDTGIPIDRVAANVRLFQSLELNVTSLESPLLSGTLQLTSRLAPTYALNASMNVRRVTLPESVRTKAPWLPEALDSRWTVKGDIESLELDGDIEWPDWMPRAHISGRIHQPLEDRRWTLNAAVSKVALPTDWLDSQTGRDLAGQPYSLALTGLELNAEGERARWEFGGVTALNSPWTRVANFEFEGTGASAALHNWAANGTAEIGVSGWPRGRVSLEATGSQDGVHGRLEAPELFGGSLAITAHAGPGETIPWEVQVSSQSVASDPLLRALSAHFDEDVAVGLSGARETLRSENLDARISARGTLQPMQISADIQQLAATVRGHRIAAGGQIEYADSAMSVSGVSVRSGESYLTLDGSPFDSPGLKLGFTVSSLADFVPGLSGSLDGRLNYRHETGKGFYGSALRGELQGKNIDSFGWSIGSLNVSVETLKALSVLATDLTGPLGNISEASARLNGAYDSKSGSWDGSLVHLEIAPESGPAWALREAAKLNLAADINLEAACLTTRQASSVCLELRRAADGALGGRLRVESLSPDILGPSAEWPVKFTQALSGELTWSRPAGLELSARADFGVSQGAAIDRADNQVLLSTGEGVLRFSLDQGRVDSGYFHIPVDSGEIDVEFSIPNILSGTESELRGRINLELENLEMLANFMPQLVQTDGRLRVDIGVGGSAGDPEFSGEFSVNDGRMQVLTPGLRVSEMELRGQVLNNSALDVQGSFLAGEGRGKLAAMIGLADPLHPTLNLHLSGDGLTLADLPEMKLRADTNVNASWDGKELRLAGSVHVPYARFLPRFQSSEVAAESPDVVIVAGAETVPAPPPESSGLRLAGELEVSMGDDVLIDLGLARATMQGSARFRWLGAPIPIADGQYDLEGEVEAYGQNLEITQATIRFPDVPANNPHLDIRGERRIYGNSLISHAGVLIHGTLKRPQIEPYTIPPTNADRARTLLVTGSDFNYEQGVGAVSVGKYISPKLYLSYGVGLFEEGNVFTIRYDLQRNFGIKATSGQDDTGIDISYTIEK